MYNRIAIVGFMEKDETFNYISDSNKPVENKFKTNLGWVVKMIY